MLALTLLMLIIGYLVGSINSAVLICRMFRLPDPRSQGSGNPGATNVLRVGGKIPALLTFVFDLLKGTIPVWSSYFLGLPPLALGLVAVMACIGHMWPVFFEFKGGKGVATAFGAMLPIGLDLGGLLLLSWLVSVYFSGYSSMGALITVLLAPIFTLFIKPLYTVPVLMISAIIVFRHKDNILRLIAGTEPNINAKQKKK